MIKTGIGKWGLMVFLILGIFLLQSSISSASQWVKIYGGTGSDIAYSIQQTSDGGYIVAGSTEFFGAGGSDAWVLKLDGNGNVQWQKAYGGTDPDEAYSIQQTSDGGYIVAGNTYSSAGYDAWVLKLNSDGTMVWQKAYDTTYDYANFIQQTSDGGYIVAGQIQSQSQFLVDAWVSKLDSNGNVQWQKAYGGTSFLYNAYSIQQTSDGGYIVAGVEGNDAWVLKLDGNGSVQWQKAYTSSCNNTSMQQTSDGGYIVTGVAESFGAGEDFFILKLDSSGNIHNCSIMKTSNAQVSNTDATIQDTNVTGVDTYVSPQTSTASVSDTNAVVKELCKYGCNLVPDATSIPRGETLELQATGTNYTNYTGSVLFATKVTKPDGNWYPSSGFLFGPLSVYLGSYESKSGHLSHIIPSYAPLGTYTYHGYVGNYGIGNYSECQFTFTVTTQEQGCTLCHQ